MKFRLLSQPFADSDDLLLVLQEWLGDRDITHFDIAVAWVKRSGLRLLSPSLAAFRGRGGAVRFIVGVSAGGATRQGLELALRNSDECNVLFVSPSRTFHPKFYIAYGPTIGRAVIGSQNFTPGGLVENFELGVELQFDLNDASDLDEFALIRAAFDKYRDVGESLVELNENVLQELVENARYRVGDEDRPAYEWDIGGAGTADGSTVAGDGSSDDIGPFGKCGLSLKLAPRSSDGYTSPPRRTRRDRPELADGSVVDNETLDSPNVVLRWTKKFSAADAQHPTGANTNPTGHLTLVKAGHDINHATWFRESLFNGAAWTEGKTQYATVEFRVEADGKRLGTFPLRVQYRPAFGAGQSNRTSMLHWGPAVGELLKRRDFTGWFVSIERYDDDSYALLISQALQGSAVVA